MSLDQLTLALLAKQYPDVAIAGVWPASTNRVEFYRCPQHTDPLPSMNNTVWRLMRAEEFIPDLYHCAKCSRRLKIYPELDETPCR